MKTNRFLVGVLSLAVVVLACLLLFGRGKSTGEKPQEPGFTNVVEVWHTNILEKWTTNTIEVAPANTVTVTNEVIKEVPAKLSELERQAATAGYRYLKAPLLSDRIDTFYKASPLEPDVQIEESAKRLLSGAPDMLRKKMEDILNSRSIPVAEKSPYNLRLHVAAVWETDVPRVALVEYRLNLNETAALERQNDIIKAPVSVWSTSTSRLTTTVNVAEEMNKSLEELLGKFCQNYLNAKEKEKETESRMPTIPSDFLSRESR